jgi:hypothetical protein
MRARIAIAMAFVICGLAAGPALADHHDHHRGRGHWEHDRGWHGPPRRHYYYSEPDVYYAPPPVIYAPVVPSPGIGLIFPFRIR